LKSILKKKLRDGCNVELFKEAVLNLINGETLYKQHTLYGGRNGEWEAPLEDDWLITWKQTTDKITFIDTGTHDELFTNKHKCRFVK
jgi:addiction module RelE/StbE family toxin